MFEVAEGEAPRVGGEGGEGNGEGGEGKEKVRKKKVRVGRGLGVGELVERNEAMENKGTKGDWVD